MDQGGQQSARSAAAARMSEMRLNATTLARSADVDVKTVRDFLSGKRWPQQQTRADLSVALGWQPSTIDRLAATGDGALIALKMRQVEEDGFGPDRLRLLERAGVERAVAGEGAGYAAVPTAELEMQLAALRAELPAARLRYEHAEILFSHTRDTITHIEDELQARALSVDADTVPDAVAALEEEESIAGEQEQSTESP